MIRGPGPNDERFIEEVEAGRFSVHAQGRIWRHILNNRPAEPWRAEYRLENSHLCVLWRQGRCYCVRARNAVWRYFYGPVPEDAMAVHKNGVRGDNRPENLEASFPKRKTMSDCLLIRHITYFLVPHRPNEMRYST